MAAVRDFASYLKKAGNELASSEPRLCRWHFAERPLPPAIFLLKVQCR